MKSFRTRLNLESLDGRVLPSTTLMPVTPNTTATTTTTELPPIQGTATGKYSIVTPKSGVATVDVSGHAYIPKVSHFGVTGTLTASATSTGHGTGTITLTNTKAGTITLALTATATSAHSTTYTAKIANATGKYHGYTFQGTCTVTTTPSSPTSGRFSISFS